MVRPYLSIYPSIHLSIYPSVRLSVCMCQDLRISVKSIQLN